MHEEIMSNARALHAARDSVYESTVDYMRARDELRDAEGELRDALIIMQAQPNAGSNEAQRRAYAIENTYQESQNVKKCIDALRERELIMMRYKALLASALDTRRALELIASLTVTTTASPVSISYARYDDGDDV